jgi:hypothetical protein
MRQDPTPRAKPATLKVTCSAFELGLRARVRARVREGEGEG